MAAQEGAVEKVFTTKELAQKEAMENRTLWRRRVLRRRRWRSRPKLVQKREVRWRSC